MKPTADSGPAPSLPARNEGIDLLRGLSVVLVVIHHMGLRLSLKKSLLGEYFPKRILNALMWNGVEAVFIFFVISGFLITVHAVKRWGSLGQISLKDFYVRRASRILPCLTLLVLILSVLHLVGAQDYVINRPGQSLGGAALSAFGFYLNWYEGQTGYLPGGWDILWSLSIEEVFYLSFPVLCFLLRKQALLVGALIVLALSLPFTWSALEANKIWQEKAYLPGMSAIATGVLAGLLATQARPRFTSALRIAGAVGIVAILLIEDLIWAHLKSGTFLVLTFSCAALLLSFQWRPLRVRAMNELLACGRLSYEIYLSHMFVVIALTQLFHAAGAVWKWAFLWYVPALIFSYYLGKGVMRYFSEPVERWIRRRFSARGTSLRLAPSLD